MADLANMKGPIRLRGTLGLSDAEADFVEELLGDGNSFSAAVGRCRHWLPLTPRRSFEDDRDRARKLASAAAFLLQALEVEDAAWLRSTGQNMSHDEFQQFVEDLGALKAGAQELADSHAALRRARGEREDQRGRGRVINDSLRLSLHLIGSYRNVEPRVSISDGSKLHRLLLLGHRAAGLAEPSFSTLRKYVSSFK
ncbi:hypothetical protein [Bosea sp. LjRoot237]|uniref:hypothetical protein n=1 Tax=Bosea sp. LjRoot237 TaxID=3342292 RepID=UPI003ECE52D9